jgi:malate dehydrogenase (oxaloacetate-decarboxylating)
LPGDIRRFRQSNLSEPAESFRDPNQVNNVLAFPGVFRGALDVRARRVTEGMKLAAAQAIAAVVADPTPGEVVPSVFDENVAPAVAAAVAAAARREGVARR